MRAVHGGARPVDRPGGVELVEQALVQRVPDAGLLPVAQPPPRGHPGAAELLVFLVVLYVYLYPRSSYNVFSL